MHIINHNDGRPLNSSVVDFIPTWCRIKVFKRDRNF